MRHRWHHLGALVSLRRARQPTEQAAVRRQPTTAPAARTAPEQHGQLRRSRWGHLTAPSRRGGQRGCGDDPGEVPHAAVPVQGLRGQRRACAAQRPVARHPGCQGGAQPHLRSRHRPAASAPLGTDGMSAGACVLQLPCPQPCRLCESRRRMQRSLWRWPPLAHSGACSRPAPAEGRAGCAGAAAPAAEVVHPYSGALSCQQRLLEALCWRLAGHTMRQHTRSPGAASCAPDQGSAAASVYKLLQLASCPWTALHERAPASMQHCRAQVLRSALLCSALVCSGLLCSGLVWAGLGWSARVWARSLPSRPTEGCESSHDSSWLHHSCWAATPPSGSGLPAANFTLRSALRTHWSYRGSSEGPKVRHERLRSAVLGHMWLLQAQASRPVGSPEASQLSTQAAAGPHDCREQAMPQARCALGHPTMPGWHGHRPSCWSNHRHVLQPVLQRFQRGPGHWTTLQRHVTVAGR